MIELIMTVVLLTATPEPQCSPGMIHWSVFCLTPDQYEQKVNPVPPTPISVVVEGVERWRPMVNYYWGRHGKTDLMLRVMWCESRGRHWVTNEAGSSATGLFQIMDFWHKLWAGDYKDPWVNAATAYQIWLSQGVGAWNASRSCWG